MRSSPWDTLSRSCARHVLCCSAFPLVPALGSPCSAIGGPTLFARFIATTAGSDSSGSFIIGFGSSPSRCGPAVACHSGQSRGLPVPVQGASMHARVSDHVGSSRPSRYRAGSCCLPHTRRTSAPEKHHFRGSMAGLHAPLSTLHERPHDRPRMTRGQCGSLLLHCDGLAPSTPCRSPGAPCADPSSAAPSQGNSIV